MTSRPHSRLRVTAICSVPGCGKKFYGKGLCKICYMREYKRARRKPGPRARLRDQTDEDFFMDRVLPEPNSGCWLWIGATTSWGYGQFKRQRAGSIISLGAHRFSWELYRGKIPSGLFVLHRCDNRCCVNPDHLFLGTTQDNTKDCVKKGRMARGESVGTSKLTADKVLQIRARLRSGVRREHVAREFGVRPSNVAWIAKRRTWKHIPDTTGGSA